jgi:2-deoxy-D-gluconate 3-dehydrogenase
VTGAARGLGRAIAVGLAEAGADIAALDVLPPAETCAEIARMGRHFHAVERDLNGLGPYGAQEVVEECAEALGRLDILVNNAGIIRRAPALDVEAGAWDTVLSVNLTAAFALSQAAARHFVAGGSGGRIINVVSMLSFQGGVLVPAYAAAKSGLAGLTRALANEWAPLGINVNAIAPGYMETEVTADLRTDAERAGTILERIPAGRWGRPDDLKGAAVFLASDASAYLHGAIIPVDGGWLAR